MSVLMSGGDNRPALLTVPEVLWELRISRALFYKLLARGDGPEIVKIGDRTLVPVLGLEEWIGSLQRPPTPQGSPACPLPRRECEPGTSPT
jgi:predicted DNA-binding transcriptional regulator AlpA